MPTTPCHIEVYTFQFQIVYLLLHNVTLTVVLIFKLQQQLPLMPHQCIPCITQPRIEKNFVVQVVQMRSINSLNTHYHNLKHVQLWLHRLIYSDTFYIFFRSAIMQNVRSATDILRHTVFHGVAQVMQQTEKCKQSLGHCSRQDFFPYHSGQISAFKLAQACH